MPFVQTHSIPSWELARRHIDGQDAYFFFGNCPAVSQSFVDIWPLGGDYPFPTAATEVELFSSDENDSGYSSAILTLTLAAQPVDGDTFTIGGRTYTFQSTLTDVDGNIHISTVPPTAAGTVLNIIDSIGLGSSGEGAGVGYAASTTANTSVTAAAGVGASVVFTRGSAYPLANDGDLEVLPTATTGVGLSFDESALPMPPGCQVVELHGLSAAGVDQKEQIVLNGTSVVPAALSYLRINRLHCQTVGTRGGSTFGTVTLRVKNGGTVLACMDGFETAGTATFGHGEAGMGLYTVPLGLVAYIIGFEVHVDNNKKADVCLYEIENCTRAAPPYLPRRLLWYSNRMTGRSRIALSSYIRVRALADLVFRAKLDSGTADVQCRCEMFVTEPGENGK